MVELCHFLSFSDLSERNYNSQSFWITLYLTARFEVDSIIRYFCEDTVQDSLKSLRETVKMISGDRSSPENDPGVSHGSTEDQEVLAPGRCGEAFKKDHRARRSGR